MQFSNLPNQIHDTPEFKGCEPKQRGVWITLMFWCGKMENGGVIENCGGWNNRKWEQIAGVTRPEIEEECELWVFDGNTLALKFYPNDVENHVKHCREIGRSGGLASAKARSKRSRK